MIVGVSPARVDSEVVLLIFWRLGGGSNGWCANLVNMSGGTNAISHQRYNFGWIWVRVNKTQVGCDGENMDSVEAAVSDVDKDKGGATACWLPKSVG